MVDESETEVDEIVEESLAKKRNVKDILVEMKDKSELMIDLAYSALLTNSKKIAEEVCELEGEMDDLQYEIETMLMLATRTPEDAADLTGILHVAHAAENVSDAARDIVDIVLRGVGDHPIYKSFLDETEEQTVKIKVAEDSGLIDKTLGELRLKNEIGCYIRAIKRGSRWIYSPRKDNKIQKDDLLIVIGTEESVDKLEKLCGKCSEESK